jgi:hypothetical protein
MLGRLLGTARFSLQVNQVKRKAVLLSYFSPLQKYTFLGIATEQLGSQIHALAQPLQSAPLDQLIEALRAQLHILIPLQKANFGFHDLHNLDNLEDSKSSVLSRYKHELIQTGRLYEEVTSVIKGRITNGNVHQWMEMCLNLNIIDLTVWSQLLKHCRTSFPSLSPVIQHKVIIGIHTYLSTKFMKFTHAPSKFIYRENALVDLGDLSELILAFLDSTLQQEAPVEERSIHFALLVELTLKISKTALVNFNTFMTHYKRKEVFYFVLLEQGGVQTAVAFIKFYAMVGLADKLRLKRVEQRMLKLLEGGGQIALEELVSLASSWSALCHYNQVLFERHLRPLILANLQAETFREHLTTLLFNLLACRLEDPLLFQTLLAEIEKNHPIDNKIMHTISHYLNIRLAFQRLSSYPHC